MTRLALALLTIAVLGACAPLTPEPVEPAPEPPGPAPAPTCAGWCARAAELGCADARPSPAGASCEARCETTMANGIIPLDLECRVRALTCAGAEACED